MGRDWCSAVLERAGVRVPAGVKRFSDDQTSPHVMLKGILYRRRWQYVKLTIASGQVWWTKWPRCLWTVHFVWPSICIPSPWQQHVWECKHAIFPVLCIYTWTPGTVSSQLLTIHRLWLITPLCLMLLQFQFHSFSHLTLLFFQSHPHICPI